jgi:hypothetical protein
LKAQAQYPRIPLLHTIDSLSLVWQAVSGSDGEDDIDSYGQDGHAKVSAGVTGTVWEIKAQVGQAVKAGETLVVLEVSTGGQAMPMIGLSEQGAAAGPPLVWLLRGTAAAHSPPAACEGRLMQAADNQQSAACSATGAPCFPSATLSLCNPPHLVPLFCIRRLAHHPSWRVPLPIA